ncbi:hypothetical protein [Micromonospora sp. NPDC048830]|uniref:hypothetical protein n=1 Tax=Micromonospora sp. NPDC048830 TaxID=3364257 RepID=UPI00371E7BA7
MTPAKWRFERDEVVLAEAGISRPGPRRPFEYAVLSAGPAWSSAEIEARRQELETWLLFVVDVWRLPGSGPVPLASAP